MSEINKLSKEKENPFDLIMIKLSEDTTDFYKQFNLTPNHLTTFSLITGLLSAYLFLLDYNILGGIFIIISYYFDCIDGLYARKYKMVTNFGDIYDHSSDLIKYTFLFIVMFNKSKQKFLKVLPIIIIL